MRAAERASTPALSGGSSPPVKPACSGEPTAAASAGSGSNSDDASGFDTVTTAVGAAVGRAVAVVLLAGQVRTLLADPTVWPPDDFVEYYAAARLTLDGRNAYDAKLLLPIERAAGRDTDQAIMMWNPPWSLTAVLPLG